jgi:tetratricopeptide (TPR) repeat protein
VSGTPRSAYFYARVALAAVIAIVAFRSAAIQLLAPLGAQAPFAFVRESEAGSDVSLFQRASGTLTDETARSLLADASATAIRHPLSANAPFAEGMAHAKLGEIRAARNAMRITVDRDPSNLIVRAWLAERALRDGQYQTALRHYNAVMRVDPTLVPKLSEAMVPFLLAPRMVDAFAEMAEDRPPWLPSFIDAARRDRRLVRQVDALMLEIADREPKAIETRNIVEVINAAESRDDFAAGLRLLKAFYPLAFADGGNMVFDPRFMAVEGAAPFLWTIERESGAVSDGTANGLEITGRVAAGTQLATQSLILTPGDYFLSARGQIAPGDLNVQWVLLCQTGGQRVATMSVSSVIAASLNGNPGLPFNVPSGCGFTSLALVASGQVSGDSPLSIQSVSVLRR